MIENSTRTIKEYLEQLGLSEYLVTDPDGNHALINDPFSHDMHLRISFNRKSLMADSSTFQETLFDFGKAIIDSPAIQSIRDSHKKEMEIMAEEISVKEAEIEALSKYKTHFDLQLVATGIVKEYE